MEASLSRADNIVEGHYAERLWASILSDIDSKSARAVDEVLSPHIPDVEFNPLDKPGLILVGRKNIPVKYWDS